MQRRGEAGVLALHAAGAWLAQALASGQRGAPTTGRAMFECLSALDVESEQFAGRELKKEECSEQRGKVASGRVTGGGSGAGAGGMFGRLTSRAAAPCAYELVDFALACSACDCGARRGELHQLVRPLGMASLRPPANFS